MGSCKRQRSSSVLDRATSSGSMEECLPQDMLEAILGKLDRGTLCTSRLVSRTFCAAALANISSLTLSFPSPAVSLERFPHLGYVKVHLNADDESMAELDPRLRAVITHLTVSVDEESDEEYDSMTLPELPEMPKLRELEVDPAVLVDGAAALNSSTSLEVIRIGHCTPSVMMTIATMTWLTSLAIVRGTGLDEGWEPPDISWVQHATNLRKLQALEISVSHKALPLIGNLTTLTGLSLGIWERSKEEAYSIAPLSRLSMLRSLDIGPDISESNLAIACSLGSGSLTKLRVVVQHASADCGRLLARQTALTRLALCGAQLSNLRHMGGLRIDLLEHLELRHLSSVDAEGLDVLQKATSLTKLRVGTLWGLQPDVRFSQTLGQLTELRCLQLNFYGSWVDTTNLSIRLALRPLTALTKLLISALRLDNGDLRVLLGLTGLQKLYMLRCRLTDGVLPELAVLTNLRTLLVMDCGVTSLAPATNIINPLREARGWPPVDVCCD